MWASVPSVLTHIAGAHANWSAPFREQLAILNKVEDVYTYLPARNVLYSIVFNDKIIRNIKKGEWIFIQWNII